MGLGLVDTYALLVLILCFGMFHLSGGVLNFFNPAALFFVFHLALLGISSWYRGLYDGRVWVSDEVVFIVYTSLLLYSAGALTAAAILSRRGVLLDLPRLQASAPTVELQRMGRLIVLLIPLALAAGYSLHIGGLVWLQGEGIDDLRVELRKGSGWIALLGIAVAFVGTVMLLCSRHVGSWLRGCLTILLLGGCAVSYGNRAPGADVLVAGLFSMWVMKYRKVPLLGLVGCAGLLIVLVAVAGLYRQGFEISSQGVMQQILWRPFVNFQNFQILYDAFPSQISFKMGNGYLIDLSVIMPGYQPNYSTWLKDALEMEFTGGGLNQTYLGELYSNFSLLPALLSSFILGAMLQLLYGLMGMLRSSLQLMLIMSFSLKSIVSSGLVSPLIYMLAPYLLVYCSYRLLLGRLFHEKT